MGEGIVVTQTADQLSQVRFQLALNLFSGQNARGEIDRTPVQMLTVGSTADIGIMGFAAIPRVDVQNTVSQNFADSLHHSGGVYDRLFVFWKSSAVPATHFLPVEVTAFYDWSLIRLGHR
jgi:hypothetical protein